MTDTKPKTHPDATASNPNAVSVRIEPKRMARALFQRRHDFRIGAQPAYVDGDRGHLNRSLMELRPLPDIQRENETLRMKAGRTRKMKSNAAVVTAGIMTFGHDAQDVFNQLPDKVGLMYQPHQAPSGRAELKKNFQIDSSEGDDMTVANGDGVHECSGLGDILVGLSQRLAGFCLALIQLQTGLEGQLFPKTPKMRLT